MSGIRSPIETFVYDVIHNQPVNKLITEWRLEETVISKVIINHFHSMGIYFCERNQRELLTGVIVFQLRNSPVLHRMLREANNNEESRRKKAILSA
jgi:hypothetical protein